MSARVALLILFAVVIFYGVQIAMSARSQFGRLLAMGITLNFFFYIMINGLMVMGLIPVVGIPMPLLSYGGTAMLTVMFGFGLLMSVHVHRQVEIPRHSRRDYLSHGEPFDVWHSGLWTALDSRLPGYKPPSRALQAAGVGD